MRKESLFYLLTIAVVVMLLFGCRGTQQIVERPVYIHDTMQVVSVQKDSVFVHDSVNVYKNGDTLYITKWLTKSVYKIQHDTIREEREVPVEVVRTETVEVEKPLKRWQKLLMWIGGVGLVGGVCCLLWKTRGVWGKRVWV